MFMMLMTIQTIEQTGRPSPGELEDLLKRVAAGDRESLAALYAGTRVAVYAAALALLRNAQDAQDVTQDTYVRVWEKADTYRPHGSPMAWLLTITRNLARMKLRQEGRVAVLTEPEWLAIPAEDHQVDPADRLTLQDALAALPDGERRVVLLHIVSGLKHREIAALLQRPLPTILSQYHRALKKLKKQLEGAQT